MSAEMKTEVPAYSRTNVTPLDDVIRIPGAELHLTPLYEGGTQISARIIDDHGGKRFEQWATSYSSDVIRAILRHDPRYTGVYGETVREESPEGIEKALTYYLLGFLSEKDFERKRTLDFGCGCRTIIFPLRRTQLDTLSCSICQDQSPTPLPGECIRN